MLCAPALKPSNDRKVSPVSKWSDAKRMHVPLVANSFGLAAGPEMSCPGATSFCEGCYAFNMERAFPAVRALTVGNLDALRSTGKVSAMVDMLTPLIDAFVVQCGKVSAKYSVDVPPVYRIHWDGDFFSAQYARAWRTVADRYPGVTFWLYTRSFDMVAPAFEGATNVTVYLSVDADNVDRAVTVAERYPYLRFAFCATTWEETEVLARRVTGRNAPRCPELTGKIPLVVGPKENGAIGRGACVDCGLCIYGRNNVRFAVDH